MFNHDQRGLSEIWVCPVYTSQFNYRWLVGWLVGWLAGWLVGWLVERLTAVAVVHRHNLHQHISGSAPETHFVFILVDNMMIT